MGSLTRANEFYLTLLSNSSHNYFPNNTLANFHTKLPTKLFLSDEWVVGLAEISFNIAKSSSDREKPRTIQPRTILIKNGQKTDRFFKIPIFSQFTPLHSLLYLLRNTFSKDLRPLDDFVGSSLSDINSDIDKRLTNIVKNLTNCEIQEGKGETIERGQTGPFSHFSIQFKCNEPIIKLQNPIQQSNGKEPITTITIFLDHKFFDIPLYNDEFESVEELMKTILLSIPFQSRSQEKILKIVENSRLPPIRIDNQEFVSTSLHPSVVPKNEPQNHMRKLMFVYTDIIKHQLVSNTFAKCLRTILLLKNDEVYKSFETIQYHPLEKTNFDTIEILITSQDGEIYNFEHSATPTMLVLHFKKKSF